MSGGARQGSRFAGDALMFGTAMLMGSSYPFAKDVLAVMSPLLFSSSRYLIASLFLFATEGGTIAGWSPSVDFTNAITVVDNSLQANPQDGAIYKGLALAANAGCVVIAQWVFLAACAGARCRCGRRPRRRGGRDGSHLLILLRLLGDYMSDYAPGD